MITRVINIANGVNLNYIETDKFKTNYFSFNFIAERSRERAHLNSMIPLILMRACAKYPTQADINKRLQYLYSGDILARNETFGEYQIFGFKVNMLDNRFVKDMDITKETSELLAEMIFNPYLVNGAFDSEYTKGEKIGLIDAIEAEINNKGKYATTRLMSEMCKDEVFGIPKYGTKEDVEKIEPNELYEAYKYALSSYGIEIYFVGKCDIDAFAETFKQCFEGVERSPIAIKEAEIVTEVKEVKEVIDVERVNQGKLVIGFRSGYRYQENKYHLLQLFNEVFGGSPVSKLFMNVREKMSLCYYCRSIIAQRSGVMLVSSGIEDKNYEVAKNAILEQLDEIKKGNITAEELESAKKSIRNGYLAIYDSAEAQEAWAFFRGMCNISTTPIDECEKIDNATIDEIKEMASRIKLDTVYLLKGEGKEE